MQAPYKAILMCEAIKMHWNVSIKYECALIVIADTPQIKITTEVPYVRAIHSQNMNLIN
jgi:hypothetical protein